MSRVAPPRSRRLPRPSVIETPTMKRKNGKTRSVGVQPLHAACSSGQQMCSHDPGLFTRIIPAIVIPRNTSSETRRWLSVGVIGGEFYHRSVSHKGAKLKNKRRKEEFLCGLSF